MKTPEQSVVVEMYTPDEVYGFFSEIKSKTENKEECQRLIDDKMRSLVQEKERFAHIFVTQNGSVYFVFSSGGSFRVKRTEKGWEPQVLVNKIVFLKRGERKRVERMLKPTRGVNGEGILNRKIKINPPAVGMFPFEFGIQKYPSIRIEETPGEIIVLGSEEGVFCSGCHFGHKITEVIK